jgi:DNA-binding transcriptional regulator YhcF (GntR family)
VLAIDPSSSTPPFEQLRRQLIEQTRNGDLAVGAKLPTVRELAATLHLAPNTVARAYRELESDHIIETRGRNGSFVSPHGDAALRAAQVAAREFATTAQKLSIEPSVALELVARALRS